MLSDTLDKLANTDYSDDCAGFEADCKLAIQQGFTGQMTVDLDGTQQGVGCKMVVAYLLANHSK